MQSAKPFIAVAATVVIWAGSITATKIGLEAIGAPELAVLHFTLSAIPAILWLLFSWQPLPKPTACESQLMKGSVDEGVVPLFVSVHLPLTSNGTAPFQERLTNNGTTPFKSAG
jgi:hypothetical protein